MSYQYSPRVNSLVSESPKCCSKQVLSHRAHMRRNTVAHKAKFAARMQLKCAICRKAATILPNFVAWILNPLKECGRKCKFYRHAQQAVQRARVADAQQTRAANVHGSSCASSRPRQAFSACSNSMTARWP